MTKINSEKHSLFKMAAGVAKYSNEPVKIKLQWQKHMVLTSADVCLLMGMQQIMKIYVLLYYHVM